jgi:hypothetical protein
MSVLGIGPVTGTHGHVGAGLVNRRQVGPLRGNARHASRIEREGATVMNDRDVAWPTGMSEQDPPARARPLVFNPTGFLVVIVQDADQAERAKAALAQAGFAEKDLRVYTSQEILDSWERFLAERSVAQRVVGAVTDDPETNVLYFGYARQGRAALWVRIPERDDAKRALRHLIDHQVLHVRYYGHDGQEDIHLR